MEQKIEKDILNEKLLFVWDNIEILKDYKGVRKINGINFSIDDYEIEKMLYENDTKLNKTDFYKNYSYLITTILPKEEFQKYEKKELLFNKRVNILKTDFPLFNNTRISTMFNLAMDRVNNELLSNPESAIDTLFKNGNIYNENTFKIIDQLSLKLDLIDRTRLYIYLINLSQYIHEQNDIEFKNSLVKKLIKE